MVVENGCSQLGTNQGALAIYTMWQADDLNQHFHRRRLDPHYQFSQHVLTCLSWCPLWKGPYRRLDEQKYSLSYGRNIQRLHPIQSAQVEAGFRKMIKAPSFPEWGAKSVSNQLTNLTYLPICNLSSWFPMDATITPSDAEAEGGHLM
jgi:hypothetical protein